MVRSGSQSIKSGQATPTMSQSEQTKPSQSRSQSRRASVAASLHYAYGEVKKKGLYNAVPTRFVVVFVAALANTLSYIMRTNMSVTIVAMVNHTASGSSSQDEGCIFPDSANHTAASEGEFNWDETMQGHILGSYYYGYIATNINGGQLADMFGARWLCGIVTLISAALTIITPFIAKWDVNALILLRVLTGLCQGVLTPAIYSLLAYWIPRNERGLVLALIQVGGNMGAVVSTIFSGYLSGFEGGWRLVFYVFGACGVLCFFLWMYTIYDTPDMHPRILDEELYKIKKNISIVITKGAQKKAIPWAAIMTSMPVWAISVAKFCGAWGNLMLMSKLPSYLKSVLHVSIQDNGYITSAVYIALSISLTGFGFFSDWIGQKRLISDTLSRKIFETIALGGPAICLILVPTAGCNLGALISLLVVAMVIFGLNAGGDKPVVVDIAPDHSGTIYGITNAIASLPGIMAPLVVGFLINLSGGLEGWNLVFYSAAGVYIFGLLFFLIFGTAKPQPWGVIERPRARTYTSRSTAASRMASRAASRGPSRKATFVDSSSSSRVPSISSRKATFVDSTNSRLPSRKPTFVQNSRQSRESSRLASGVSTPHRIRKAQAAEQAKEDFYNDNKDIFAIDLSKAIDRVQQQLSERIEIDTDERTATNPLEVLEYAIDLEDLDYDDMNLDENMNEEEDEEYVDEEEEKAQRLQYFRERRFSVFPIA